MASGKLVVKRLANLLVNWSVNGPTYTSLTPLFPANKSVNAATLLVPLGMRPENLASIGHIIVGDKYLNFLNYYFNLYVNIMFKFF